MRRFYPPLLAVSLAMIGLYEFHRSAMDEGFECGELLELHIAHPSEKPFEDALKHECAGIVSLNGSRVPSVFAPVGAEYRTVKAKIGMFFAESQQKKMQEFADRRQACARVGIPGTLQNVDVKGRHYDSIECSMDDLLRRPQSQKQAFRQ